MIEFLTPLKCEKYSTIFIQSGFDDLEAILDLDKDCLIEMHVNLGH